MAKETEVLKTHNEFSGFLREKLLKDAQESGLKPGELIKMIVHQHYKNDRPIMISGNLVVDKPLRLEKHKGI